VRDAIWKLDSWTAHVIVFISPSSDQLASDASCRMLASYYEETFHMNDYTNIVASHMPRETNTPSSNLLALSHSIQDVLVGTFVDERLE
jgi:hypothetical protein